MIVSPGNLGRLFAFLPEMLCSSFSDNPREVGQQAESDVRTTASLSLSPGAGGFTFAESRGQNREAKPPAIPASRDWQRNLTLPSQQPLS